METQQGQPTEQLTCRIVKSNTTYAGKQGLSYFAGISTETVGARGICMHLLRMPPGTRAKAHLHEQHETAIYMLRGETQMWYGDKLDQHMVIREGEFLYIPANMPHLPFNASTEDAVALLARTDPNEQESVLLLPELEKMHEEQVT